MSRKLFIAGNWKMNKTASEAAEDVSKFIDLALGVAGKINIALCPPFTALDRVSLILENTGVELGAQNLSEVESGAYTGEVSAAMLRDLNVKYVIVGHSERRQYFGETDEVVSLKANRALQSGLLPIICIGETLEEREANKTFEVIQAQMKGSFAGISKEDMLKTTIAYEPIWAIGTGKTATPEQAQEVHAFIRKIISETYGAKTAAHVIIQYGGSVKAANSGELMAMPDIDGALVGGASLDPVGFAELIKNALQVATE